jgi:hypothetical protein
MGDISVKTAAEVEGAKGTAVERLFGVERGETDEGLFAETVVLGPDTRYTAADPRSGGGQVILVLQGSLVHGGTEMAVRSALAVTQEENAVSFASGPRGLQALVLQYPKRSAPHA